MKNKVPMQRLMVGRCVHSTKVTYLGNGLWGCRVFLNDSLNQEIVVDSKRNIGRAFKSMLRMEDKCGNLSAMASAARMR